MVFWTFEGLRYREIAKYGTVTINIKLTVWKLKDTYYNHQALRILAKKRSITTITSPNVCAYLIACDCIGHVEGSCMGTDISITSAKCNHQNCKQWCIYQVLKFPNWSCNCCSGVHSLLMLYSAWSSCYMWKHQMLITYSNNYLTQKL